MIHPDLTGSVVLINFFPVLWELPILPVGLLIETGIYSSILHEGLCLNVDKAKLIYK